MARSNISNSSSRSHLLTLSQDSNCKELHANPMNTLYRKFIGRLSELFRIGSQDLDLLYNKIVQCANESESFAKSNDAESTS
jgi:hypothetical protein